MIDAPEINNVLEQIKQQLLASKSNRGFVKTLSEAFVEFDCKFKLLYKAPLSEDEYAVSGFYRPDSDTVTIVFHVNGRRALLDIQEHEWAGFKFLFSQTLQHELIHRFQYASRDEQYEAVEEEIDYRYFDEISLEEEIDYLKDSDEIDAYAHDIAMEILFHYKKKNPLEVLRKIDRRRKVWSYSYYKNVFKKHDEQEWTVIKKRLLKKAFTWLPYTTIYR